VNVLFPPMHRGRCLLLALITLLFCLPGVRASAQAAPAQAAPTQSNAAQAQAAQAQAATVRLRGHVPFAALARAQAMGRVPRRQTLSLSLALPLRDRAGLESFLNRLYDPADPLYGQYITPDEFTRRYSPTQQSYDAVAAFARAHGLAVTRTTPNRLLLSVSGSAAAVESAFAVHLGRYQGADGRVFHAPDADPAIPVSLIGRLSGVIGLDNASVRHPYLRRHAARPALLMPILKPALKPRVLKQAAAGAQAPAGIGTDPNTGALSPSDIKAAYSLDKTPLTGAGQTLALFELDTYTPSDIATYESAFGLPNVPLENVPVDPADPNFPSTPGGGAGEVTLDIEVMAAVAPGASKILVYESPNTDKGIVDQYNQIATDDRAKVISSSWGIAENEAAKATRDAENTAFMLMAAQGQTIFAAAGDFGAYDDTANLSVDDPASQPYMTGVGGTKLSVVRAGGVYNSESAWGDPTELEPNPFDPFGSALNPFGAGGGGGISAVWPSPTSPAYQTGVGQSITQRNVPDVSLNADPRTGYAIYYSDPQNPGWTSFGGTSVAAPIWAAFTALANQQRAQYGYRPVGFANPLIYQIGKSAKYSSAFHDVNDDSTNLFFHATLGYDNATGWGSFNGAGLLPLFAPAPNTAGSAIAALTLTPNPVVGGLAVTGTVTLANPAPTGGATVTLTSTDATVAPVPASVVIAAGQTSATFTFTTGVTTTGTTVTVTASYQGSSLGAGLVVQPSPTVIVPASLSLAPASVNGGDSTQATVTLTGPAPKGGLVVTLSSSDPAAQVPASVTVPAAATSATFTVTTSQVSQQVVATLTASANGKSATAALTVLAPTLEKLVLTPPTLPGGQNAIGTLNLTFAAPAGGGVVTLSSDNPAAVVPATATIPGGGTTQTFTVTTKAVPKTVIATITATFDGLSQTAKLEIRSARISGISVAPASLTGGAPAVGTVTLDSPVAVAAGLVVTLAGSDPAGVLPATVTVPLGATTATFPLTTTVVPAPVADTITATLDGISKTTLLSVQPIQATSLTLNPSSVIAGVSSVGTVTVNAPAPPGGLVVTLSLLGAAETLPATATIPAGATSGTFTIGTPVAGSATISAVVGGQTRTATLTVTTAVGTSFPAGLNMISVPYDYSGQPLDDLFGYAGVRLAAYQADLGQYAFTPAPPADALRLGRSYFVKLPHAVTLSRVGAPADPTTDFSIPLLTGWNMIGDPFLVPIPLGSVHASAGGSVSTFANAVSSTPLLLSSLLYSFNPAANSGKGGYTLIQSGGSLQPGQGYWIYAYSPVSLVIPHPGQ
jgi:hypothetical protein